jgi:tetratricopeptide (TPR) repeat protein
MANGTRTLCIHRQNLPRDATIGGTLKSLAHQRPRYRLKAWHRFAVDRPRLLQHGGVDHIDSKTARRFKRNAFCECLDRADAHDAHLVAAAQAAADRALVAEEIGDAKAAAKEWDAYVVAYANPTMLTAYPTTICYAAASFEKTGQPAKADAALTPFGNRTFVDCYRFRGDVLDLRGDWSGAQQWYAKAVTMAPDIPSGYYSWGVALVRHGDPETAAKS